MNVAVNLGGNLDVHSERRKAESSKPESKLILFINNIQVDKKI